MRHFVYFLVLAASAGCHPKIFLFRAEPATIGPNDPISISWNVKGNPYVLIHDINYPNSGTTTLSPVTILVTQHGKTDTFSLAASDTIRLSQASQEDSLLLIRKKDGLADDRLRYITLVVSRYGKDSSRTIQVAARPDAAADRIGFRTALHGDTLIAAGLNNPVRWGTQFEILTVTNGSNLPMEVIHEGISRMLNPGGPPDPAFKGTSVQGDWIFRRLLSPAEKNNPHLIPAGLLINITIKHR